MEKIEQSPYSEGAVNRIFKILELREQKGQSRYYEVFVDDFKVTEKTNDLNEFYDYLDLITPDTRFIKFKLYSSSDTSARNDKYQFNLKQPEPQVIQAPQAMALSGLDIEARITEKLLQERGKWDSEMRQKELEDTKSKLIEAEDYIGKLEMQLEQFKGKKMMWGDVNLGEVASVVLEGVIRRNPQLLAGIPGAESLAGVLNTPKPHGIAQPPAEVSFARKDSAINPANESYITILKQLETVFDQHELDTVMQILATLSRQPQHLPTIAELLAVSVTQQPIKQPTPQYTPTPQQTPINTPINTPKP